MYSNFILPETASRVYFFAFFNLRNLLYLIVRHYSGYIAALSTRTSYGPDGYPRPQVDEDLRGRLEAKLIISILDFDLS